MGKKNFIVEMNKRLNGYTKKEKAYVLGAAVIGGLNAIAGMKYAMGFIQPVENEILSFGVSTAVNLSWFLINPETAPMAYTAKVGAGLIATKLKRKKKGREEIKNIESALNDIDCFLSTNNDIEKNREDLLYKIHQYRFAITASEISGILSKKRIKQSKNKLVELTKELSYLPYAKENPQKGVYDFIHEISDIEDNSTLNELELSYVPIKEENNSVEEKKVQFKKKVYALTKELNYVPIAH